MAQHNFTKLAAEGRAYDETRAWSEEELSALITLEQERGIKRDRSALFVRNGILTISAYDSAIKAGFEPKSLEDLRAEATTAYLKQVRSELRLDEPEEVIETELEVVHETEEVEKITTDEVIEPETEEVIEPEEVIEVHKETKSKTKATK